MVLADWENGKRRWGEKKICLLCMGGLKIIDSRECNKGKILTGTQSLYRGQHRKIWNAIFGRLFMFCTVFPVSQIFCNYKYRYWNSWRPFPFHTSTWNIHTAHTLAVVCMFLCPLCFILYQFCSPAEKPTAGRTIEGPNMVYIVSWVASKWKKMHQTILNCWWIALVSTTKQWLWSAYHYGWKSISVLHCCRRVSWLVLKPFSRTEVIEDF